MPKAKVRRRFLQTSLAEDMRIVRKEIIKEIELLCEELGDLIKKDPNLLATLSIRRNRSITCREVFPQRKRGRSGNFIQRRFIDTEGRLWWSPQTILPSGPLSESSPHRMYMHDIVWWRRDLKKLAKQLRKL